MINGVLNVWKEAGFTSHDVVAKLRGILHQKKIGHTGTLDPDATGVLPVCLGKGTRLCDMLTDETKTYEALLHLGIATDTQDMSGTVTAEAPVTVTEEEVRDCIASFVGEHQQVPPMYSALRSFATADDHAKKLAENGNPLKPAQIREIGETASGGDFAEDEEFRLYLDDGTFVGIYQYRPSQNLTRPVKLFLERT